MVESNGRIDLAVEDIRDLRRRVDDMERRLSVLEGAVKTLAFVVPVGFTLLNILLRLLKLV